MSTLGRLRIASRKRFDDTTMITTMKAEKQVDDPIQAPIIVWDKKYDVVKYFDMLLIIEGTHKMKSELFKKFHKADGTFELTMTPYFHDNTFRVIEVLVQHIKWYFKNDIFFRKEKVIRKRRIREGRQG